MTIRQVDIARALDVSPMTVSRALKVLGREGGEMTEYDALRVLLAAELQGLGLESHVAIPLLSQFSGEVRYVLSDLGRRVCWITFVDAEPKDIRLASLNPEDLQDALARFPLSLVVSLHELIQRAAQRLAKIKEHKGVK